MALMPSVMSLHLFLDALGLNAVLPVEVVLDCPPAVGLVNGLFHRVRDPVGVHHDVTVGMTGGPADGLDHRSLGPQVTLFIGVQNGHQTDLRQVEALPQQVDAPR